METNSELKENLIHMVNDLTKWQNTLDTKLYGYSLHDDYIREYTLLESHEELLESYGIQLRTSGVNSFTVFSYKPYIPYVNSDVFLDQLMDDWWQDDVIDDCYKLEHHMTVQDYDGLREDLTTMLQMLLLKYKIMPVRSIRDVEVEGDYNLVAERWLYNDHKK